MNQAYSKDPCEQATFDWNARRPVHLVVGTVDISRPAYYCGDVFYTESFGCLFSPEAELYCRSYNRTVRAFLEKYGVPSWAPVKRLPDSGTCLAAFKDKSSLYSSYKPLSPQEEMVVNRILNHRGSAQPSCFARLCHQGILLLGGDSSPDMGRVDVVDLLDEIKWMAAFTYPREEYSHFPWNTGGDKLDKLVSDHFFGPKSDLTLRQASLRREEEM